VLNDAVSLGNRYSTYREKQVFSYTRVDNIKNISLHEIGFAILFQKSITNYPVTWSYV